MGSDRAEQLNLEKVVLAVTEKDELLRKTNELKKYFDISYAYVTSLKPKKKKKGK
jgi:hypothetical protein